MYAGEEEEGKREEEEEEEEGMEEMNDIDELMGDVEKNQDQKVSQKAPKYNIEKDNTKTPSSLQSKSKKPKRWRKILLISAWVLANLAIFVSAFFVILYSMEWGGSISNAWLISFLLSFTSSAFFIDPLKVSMLHVSSLCII